MAAGFFWVAFGFHGNELGRKKHAASTVFSCVDIGCHFGPAGLSRLTKKVEEKTATYLTGNQNDRLPLPVATSETKVATRDVGLRLATARDALGLSQVEFARSYGGSKAGIQDNEAGKNMPGGKVLLALVKLGISANWVLTGDGRMRIDDGGDRQVINDEALAAIIYALLKARPGDPDPDFIARSAVEAYKRYVSAGVITPTGISPKGSRAA